ncbi:uncharacterized protein LOC127463772 isoform X7 [Manacus candei]|uniref:uncharacterized protein LOC127463772 isoform X7 n=1 Tax=Manacus candei TaxID=415023 RepID=UPI002227F1AB|nr:uncharacterized protein LOC127463772 isoform X7 [Manacus candei]
MGTRGIQDWDTPIPKVLRDGDRDTPIPGGSRTGIPPFPRSWGVSLKPLRGLGTGFQLCFLPNSHPDFPGLFSPLPALCNSRIYRFLFLLPNSPEIPDNPGLFSHLPVFFQTFQLCFLPHSHPDFPGLFSPLPLLWHSQVSSFIFFLPNSGQFQTFQVNFFYFPILILSFQVGFLPSHFSGIPNFPGLFSYFPIFLQMFQGYFLTSQFSGIPNFPGLFSHLPSSLQFQTSQVYFLTSQFSGIPDLPGFFSHLPVFFQTFQLCFLPNSHPDFPGLHSHLPIPDLPGLFSPLPLLWHSQLSRFIFSPPNSPEIPDFPALFSHLTVPWNSRFSRFIFSPPTSLEFQTSQVYFLPSHFSGIPNFPDSFPFN